MATAGVVVLMAALMAALLGFRQWLHRRLVARPEIPASRTAELEDARFWSRWAGRYDRFMERDAPLYDRMAALMKERLGRDMHVLELACGTGALSGRIAGRVRSLEATDFSTRMIAVAKSKPGSARLHYSVQDAADLPYASGSFDAVVIANALHVMLEPDRVMAEIRRVLRPGGLLIAPTFLHGEHCGLRARMLALAGFRVRHRWSEAGFLEYVRAQGFSVLRSCRLDGGVTPLCYLEAENVKNCAGG